MKKTILSVALYLSAALISNSCKKDAGNLPKITFKSGGNYVASDGNYNKKTAFTIGIDAKKSESEDVLKKFNISKSVNGGSDATVYSQDLTGSDGNSFSYDYSAVMDSIIGQKNKYTFTVTNRDGLVNQVELTLTVQ